MYKVKIASSLVIALAIYVLTDAPEPARLGLVTLWLAASFWILELLHITVTALLIPVIATGLGLLPMKQALEQFSHPIIFLFLGGFSLACALHHQQVDQAIARHVLRISRGRLGLALTLLAATAALLSMWISNTATTAIMVPLVIGLLRQNHAINTKTTVFALLIIAYSASIGGMATITGSPPNAIVAAQLELSFKEWFSIGLPLCLLLWPVMLMLVYFTFRPELNHQIKIEQVESFEWTSARKKLLVVFLMTATGWLFSRPLSILTGVEEGFDSWVAITAIIALTSTRVINWHDIAKDTDWGVLLLFGGGLTLSKVLSSTGASQLLGEWLTLLVVGWPPLLLLAAVIAFVIFLTELSSNTATTALLVPIFLAMPFTGLAPEKIAIAIGISASCAFMLPVATPPNAIVHGTGKVPLKDMMRAGLRLNLAGTCILALAIYLIV